MQTQDIHLTDWARILVGSVPGSFYVELVIRAVIFFALLVICMRLMGKRMSSQIGRNQLAAMASLAAAIGVPLQAPDRGILPAFVIAFVVIVVERWIANRTYHSQSFEKIAQGNIGLLVKDAVLDLESMKKVRLTRERLVAQLRTEGIKQLGRVQRFYMEANGNFTLIEAPEPKPGLSIIPRWDKDFQAKFKKSDDLMVCQTCGTTQKKPFEPNAKCPNCNECKWTEAVEE